MCRSVVLGNPVSVFYPLCVCLSSQLCANVHYVIAGRVHVCVYMHTHLSAGDQPQLEVACVWWEGLSALEINFNFL